MREVEFGAFLILSNVWYIFLQNIYGLFRYYRKINFMLKFSYPLLNSLINILNVSDCTLYTSNYIFILVENILSHINKTFD